MVFDIWRREQEDRAEMCDNPLVTLIIPVFNVYRYLLQCLDSVFEQSYRHLEILIIDDGSTDGSAQICDDYALKDSRATVFHTENYGLSAARNYGLDRAQGDYIVFLDSDDWLERNAIERLIDFVLGYDADIVACNIYRDWVNKTTCPPIYEQFTVCHGERALHDFICLGFKEDGVWNKIYRANMFSELRFPEGRLCEDAAVTYRLLESAKTFVSIPEALFHYRMRRSGICYSATMQFYMDFCLARCEMYEALEMKGEEYRKECLSRYIRIVMGIWLGYSDLSKREPKMDSHILNERFNLIHDFSYTHLREALCGELSMKEKMFFCLSLCHNPIYMMLLSEANRLRWRVLRKNSAQRELLILYA